MREIGNWIPLAINGRKEEGERRSEGSGATSFLQMHGPGQPVLRVFLPSRLKGADQRGILARTGLLYWG